MHTHTHIVSNTKDSIRFIGAQCLRCRFQETSGTGWLCCWGPPGDRWQVKVTFMVKKYGKYWEETWKDSERKIHGISGFLDDKRLVWKWNSARNSTEVMDWWQPPGRADVTIQWKVDSEAKKVVSWTVVMRMYRIVSYGIVLYHSLYYICIVLDCTCMILYGCMHTYTYGIVTCRHVNFVTRSRPLSPRWAGGPRHFLDDNWR